MLAPWACPHASTLRAGNILWPVYTTSSGRRNLRPPHLVSRSPEIVMLPWGKRKVLASRYRDGPSATPLSGRQARSFSAVDRRTGTSPERMMTPSGDAPVDSQHTPCAPPGAAAVPLSQLCSTGAIDAVLNTLERTWGEEHWHRAPCLDGLLAGFEGPEILGRALAAGGRRRWRRWPVRGGRDLLSYPGARPQILPAKLCFLTRGKVSAR